MLTGSPLLRGFWADDGFARVLSFLRDNRSRVKLPAIQFYIGDYKKDPCVETLSFEARAVWFEMIMLMHESPRRGYLINTSGKQMSAKQLANAFHTSEQLVSDSITEMENAGTFSRDENNVIYNRRMARETAISEKRAAAGAIGGRNSSEAKSKQNASKLEATHEQLTEDEDECEEEVLANTSTANSTDISAERKPNSQSADNSSLAPAASVQLPTIGSNALKPVLVQSSPQFKRGAQAEDEIHFDIFLTRYQEAARTQFAVADLVSSRIAWNGLAIDQRIAALGEIDRMEREENWRDNFPKPGNFIRNQPWTTIRTAKRGRTARIFHNRDPQPPPTIRCAACQDTGTVFRPEYDGLDIHEVLKRLKPGEEPQMPCPECEGKT